MTNELDKWLNHRLASLYDLKCSMCPKGQEKPATRTTSDSDSVCEQCAKEYAIAQYFADEPELDAYFAGTASEEFTARCERYWKWHEED